MLSRLLNSAFDYRNYMVTTFKYSLLRRLMVILILSPLTLVPYGFIREALPVENYLFSILCIIVAISFGVFVIHILNEHWLRVIINENGISVKKLYNSYFAEWEDIIEYGREQPFGYGGDWKYYVIVKRKGDRKLKVCHGRLKELRKLNAHIISKLDASRLKNISPGMID
jgi:hypothetical protein